MISVDTNIVFYATQPDSPLHSRAQAWMETLVEREDVAVSELMLAELYCLLRNPSANRRPLAAEQAVELIQGYRQHPRWRLLGLSEARHELHDEIWAMAAKPGGAFRRIYDVRLAISLLRQGVDEFATANLKDFQNLGFRRVWNPLTEA